MQGTWLENTPLYSKYGDKRRKQTRKHTIKDKFKPLIKKFHYKDMIDKSGTYKDTIDKYNYVVQDEIIKHSQKVEVYKVNIKRYYKIPNTIPWEYNISSSIRYAYKFNKSWYDSYINQIIGDIGEVNIIKFEYFTFIHFNPPLITPIKYTKSSYFGHKSSIWFYDKPIDSNWHNKYGFWSTRRRKFYQNLANRRDRRLSKNYCIKGDWDKDVKSHSSSRSINWDVW